MERIREAGVIKMEGRCILEVAPGLWEIYLGPTPIVYFTSLEEAQEYLEGMD